ncbi:MAG TPA: DUF4124 domain-containing protein [Gammaproteobacteria bacterium]|nr:DUF4124 domain-containing protein [Gammaproteobacteria bacterium]
MKWIAVILLAALTALNAAHADQVYKWVDAQGNVHYSDKPHPGAEKIKIAQPQSYSAPAEAGSSNETRAVQGDRRPTPPPPAETHYTIAITSPAQQSSVWNTRSVTVSANVSPGLGPGDTVTFELDGKPLGPVAQTSVTFDDLDRGEHTVSATLNTADGQTIKAAPVTFYLHQTTVFHGKPPA